MKPFKQLVFSLSLSLMLSGCSIYNSEYYIPVNNQMGDAQPLSKNDVIRVVITHNYLDVPPHPKPGWTNWGYFIAARRETNKYLQKLDYHLIDTEENPYYDGHPTVIALVNSSPIEESETTETHTWDSPVFTDDMGRTTLSEKRGVTITHRTYYYKVKLVRPEGKDNPLFTCLSSQDNMRVCIAPANPSNYTTIFSGYATISTDNPNPFGNLAHLTAAVFYNYPNMMDKKWVYFTNTGYTPLYATAPNAPKPTNKK